MIIPSSPFGSSAAAIREGQAFADRAAYAAHESRVKSVDYELLPPVDRAAAELEAATSALAKAKRATAEATASKTAEAERLEVARQKVATARAEHDAAKVAHGEALALEKQAILEGHAPVFDVDRLAAAVSLASRKLDVLTEDARKYEAPAADAAARHDAASKAEAHANLRLARARYLHGAAKRLIGAVEEIGRLMGDYRDALRSGVFDNNLERTRLNDEARCLREFASIFDLHQFDVVARFTSVKPADRVILGQPNPHAPATPPAPPPDARPSFIARVKNAITGRTDPADPFGDQE